MKMCSQEFRVFVSLQLGLFRLGLCWPLCSLVRSRELKVTAISLVEKEGEMEQTFVMIKPDAVQRGLVRLSSSLCRNIFLFLFFSPFGEMV